MYLFLVIKMEIMFKNKVGFCDICTTFNVFRYVEGKICGLHVDKCEKIRMIENSNKKGTKLLGY